MAIVIGGLAVLLALGVVLTVGVIAEALSGMDANGGIGEVFCVGLGVVVITIVVLMSFNEVGMRIMAVLGARP